jgi:hypothetical protein
MNPEATLEIFPPKPAGEKKPEDRGILGPLSLLAAEIGSKLDNFIAGPPDQEPWDHSANNWASEIAHPCELHLTYKRTRWREDRRMDLDGSWRVKEGQDQEKRTKALLDEVGFTMVKAQTRVTIPELKISGKIDGMIETPDRYKKLFRGIREIPVEVKSLNPTYWPTTRTLWDIKHHPKFWIRKHPSQLNIYIAGWNIPGGLLILKTFGQRPRILPMALDLELLTRDYAMAAKVNRNVEAGSWPAPIPYERDTCQMCGFNAICPGGLHATEFLPVEQSETVLLEHYLELQEAAKSAKAAFEEIKENLIGDEEKPGRYYGQNAIVNDIEIKSGKQNRKEVKLTEEAEARINEIEEPFIKRKEIVVTTIKRTGPAKGKRGSK